MSAEMADRELLELAAKAAGIGPVIGFENGGLVIGPRSRQRFWSPLTDDGDALRLAVKIRMLVDADGEVYPVATATPKGAGLGAHVQHKGDPYAATRRAIVLAAAEIGRAMK